MSFWKWLFALLKKGAHTRKLWVYIITLIPTWLLTWVLPFPWFIIPIFVWVLLWGLYSAHEYYQKFVRKEEVE